MKFKHRFSVIQIPHFFLALKYLVYSTINEGFFLFAGYDLSNSYLIEKTEKKDDSTSNIGVEAQTDSQKVIFHTKQSIMKMPLPPRLCIS